MKEYSFPYDAGIAVGLIPANKIKYGIPGLVECYNCKISKEGLDEYVAMTNPFVGIPAGTVWPYPQVFKTTIGIFVATETAIYKADDSYVLSAMITGLPAGNVWEMADYFQYQIWTNGVATVVRDAETGVFYLKGMAHPIESICNYNGQLIAGGFGGDKGNWVAWGGIGKIDLDNLLSDVDRTNVSGFMPMPFRGDVYRVKKLGDKIIIYGSDGICALTAGSLYKSYKSYTTFGREDIFTFGIAGKECVGGNDSIHMFIDNSGYIRAMDKSGGHHLLGYINYTTNFTDEIKILYDENLAEFYITDGNRCYLYTTGLSEIYQCPSGIVRVGSTLYGTSYDGSDLSAYMTTNSFSIMTESIKTVQTVEASVRGVNLQGAVDYRYNKSTTETFTRSMLKNMSRHGIFTPMVSGVDLRIHIRSSSFVGFSLDRLMIRYKMTDKRSIRGPYAEQPGL